MEVVTLVPWRGGETNREHNWKLARPHLEALGYPLFLGDSIGKWARAAAINTAAREAGAWDVAIIADADTVPDPDVIRRAIHLAHKTGGGVRPHDRLHRLTRLGTSRWARGEKLKQHRYYIKEVPRGGGMMVVSRKGWDLVGGFDERCVGWGHEDTVFGIQLLVKADWDRLAGDAWHLWHPDVRPIRTAEYRRNRQLMNQLLRTHRQVLDEASARKGFDVARFI